MALSSPCCTQMTCTRGTIRFPVKAVNADPATTSGASATEDSNEEPKLEACKRLGNSTIITKDNRKIGIVGYIRADTKERTQPNNVGHSGYEKDMEIAKKCPDVDVVVGGQSHTLLYTGKPPAMDISEGPYPTIVVKPDGRKVPNSQ